VGDCDSLRELMIGNCALTGLPATLGKLQQLKQLNVHNDAPPSVNRQQAQLGIEAKYTIKNYNQVRSLPASLVNCSQLSVLDVSGNVSLEEKALWPIVQQFRLPTLMLNLSNCNLDSIPMTGWLDTQIGSLQLGNNQLTQFPTDWFKTKGIRQLFLFSNKLPPALMNYSSFEERLLIGDEMGIDVPKPFPQTKEMAVAYLSQAGKKMNTDPLRFVEYMKQVQQIDSTAGKYMPEVWGRFYFFTHRYRRSVDSLTAAVNRYTQVMKNIPDNQKQRFIIGIAPLLDFRGQAKWHSGDSLGAIKDHELLVEDYKLFAPNIWGRLGVWYKLYRPTTGKSGAAFDKAISMYENVRNQPPMTQLSAAEVYLMNDQADKAYEYLFGLDRTNFKSDEKLLADYLLLCTQIVQKQAGEDEVNSFEKRLKSQNIQIKNWSYQLFEEALNSLEIDREQKTLIKRLTASAKSYSLVVD
jgi:tetratricopeptide (TPR) repeat protein